MLNLQKQLVTDQKILEEDQKAGADQQVLNMDEARVSLDQAAISAAELASERQTAKPAAQRAEEPPAASTFDLYL
ncbi:hypothetical protein [Kineosporia succinea]|uniref:DNA-binding protein H-NS n=1 Tax=Kineosporia succinea TaxID=84632 RepID=A0ABT9PFC8_9ACTN|nr:hypothetical protein [Kineosporia succinea]MDP9830880.1 DNA-binding protein H-NS [Kineosporia succinea]